MATCNVQNLLNNAAALGNLSHGEWEILELQLLCEILNSGAGGVSLQSQSVATNNSSVVYQVSHGLGSVPKIFRVLFQCISNDAATGYLVGDELEVSFLHITNPADIQVQTFADATTVRFIVPQVLVGNEGTYGFLTRSGSGFITPTSFNNFKIKFYYG